MDLLYKDGHTAPYEFSVFIAPIIMIPFLNWKNDSEYYKNICWIILSCICSSFDAHKTQIVEYSIEKLAVRSCTVGILILIITFNSVLYIPPTILLVLFFTVGYLFISCITQYVMLNNLIKIPSNDNIKDIEKEEEIQEKITTNSKNNSTKS